MNILVTGGSGFLGELLVRRLLERGDSVVNIDLQPDPTTHDRLTSIQGDLRDQPTVRKLFAEHRFDGVIHAAAMLAHAVKDKKFLWESNVEGTRNVAQAAANAGVKPFVFVSTNCLWAKEFNRPVLESDSPEPIEIYGQSKAAAEKLLLAQTGLNAVIIRTPTIIDAGRLGLLAILFDFIREGRKVWVVGKGENRYQFVYAQDLIDACLMGLQHHTTTIYNVGSENVKSLRDVYDFVITKAETGSYIASLPKSLTLTAMRSMYGLGLSPLGPYQYRMIASNFEFDTSKIRRELGWKPTLTNEEILYKAYDYYASHYNEIQARGNVSAHKQSAKMGVIRLLKWLS